MKPLLFIPSPRDIEQVKQSIDKLKVDKLWLKYFPQEQAYPLARHWFLEHDEYTHLVIHPDDLIANNKDLEQLKHDCVNGAYYDDVISGWCNNTAGTTDDVDTDFTLMIPPMQTSEYWLYNFVPITKIPNNKTIIPVKHQGTALTFMPRVLVRKIPFRTEFPPDLCLSHDLSKNKIPQYVDLRVRMKHLRHPHGIMVGQKQEELIFEKVL